MACDTPYQVRNPKKISVKDKDWIPVPCGKCPKCLERRKESWCFRLKKQDEVSASSLFVTLTYDNEHVPRSKNGFLTLDKDDFQNFMKALRRNNDMYYEASDRFTRLPALGDPIKISYYAVGEYGSTTSRPHYHAIIFNASDTALQKSWKHGHIDIGTFSTGSVSYVASYLNKGRVVPAHPRDDRLKEFALMSKKMGINYLSSAVVDYHKADITRNYITVEGGYRKPLPRYFRDKIYSESERQAYAEISSSIHEVDEVKRQEKYFTEHGTLDGYTYSKFEQLTAKLANYHKRQRDKRNKL